VDQEFIPTATLVEKLGNMPILFGNHAALMSDTDADAEPLPHQGVFNCTDQH